MNRDVNGASNILKCFLSVIRDGRAASRVSEVEQKSTQHTF